MLILVMIFQLFTEHVRLTDEEMIQAMTDEEGDVFHWLKHQSEQGVLSAQVNYDPIRTRCFLCR